ncbi:HAD superfamily (subfamily IA) hydrolase, TIGR01548 [[Leptolyngbya] sp. PCC 7376]|uniref:TIGR01548 family HAD-type hydrolase n=1 Tax=[Leptolyngbya] sp. PCC 7376 TaxID=111781 RepID=UPI00029F3877|nr:TIGR01548 family HAD-type hydrolase [[Leptolyngbya] sp. PCC 7376]AFY38966.1 HAD superfamily (subfamily IA) hydrolase, TIGR01548 [[Leptolyngbya] sp. PCC 7376]
MLKGLVIFDIDGVVRDVSKSYRRAIADTVEHYTKGEYRPSMAEIDSLKAEGFWNNDWKASQEFIKRWDEEIAVDYDELVNFFQLKYRGNNFDGYITEEPLLMNMTYLDGLSDNNFGWGFFSGAMRGSAEFILKKRLGLTEPVLVAMEDAPEKPDPTGLFQAIAQLESPENEGLPVAYVGDTAADMKVIGKAAEQQPTRQWCAIGVIPPHARTGDDKEYLYASNLQDVGADIVLPSVTEITPQILSALL